jgi:hypothetical protein
MGSSEAVITSDLEHARNSKNSDMPMTPTNDSASGPASGPAYLIEATPEELSIYPPTIYLTDIPLGSTIPSLLSMVRVPNGNIRRIEINGKWRQAAIVFADIIGHNAFLEAIHCSTLGSLWPSTANVTVDATNLLKPSAAEMMTGVTRVLRVHGIAKVHLTLDGLLSDLASTSNGHPYRVVKALHGRLGNSGDSEFMCVSFTSIQDSVRAMRMFQAPGPLAEKYRDIRFCYGYDECSTTGRPMPLVAITQVRSGIAGPGVTESTTAEGTFFLGPALPTDGVEGEVARPPVAPATLAPAPAPVFQPPPAPVMAQVLTPMPASAQAPLRTAEPNSKPAPEPGPMAAMTLKPNIVKSSLPEINVRLGKYPLPPFRCYRHGILVQQIPISLTELELLASICGGKVRRVFIFRPGRDVTGNSAHGAVFFCSRTVADRVVARVKAQGGLWIATVGRRYRTTPFYVPQGQRPSDEVVHNYATRIVSLTFEDIPENKSVTSEVVRNVVRKRTTFELEERQVKEVLKLGSANPAPDEPMLRSFVVEMTSIYAAGSVMTALAYINVTGKRHAIEYNPDPCAAPLMNLR